MGLNIPWLEMVSKKEQRRREEKARKMMFPFGDEQRTVELELMHQLIKSRSRDQELLFQLYLAKDCLQAREDEDDEDRETRLVEWLHSKLAKDFTPEERMRFLALAELEQNMQDLSEMPDLERIKDRARNLLQDNKWL